MVAGDVMNTAARIQAAAPVDGILVGDSTHRATERVIVYREHQPVEAKGKVEPVEVWEAVEALGRVAGPGEDDASSPLVGRENERALLLGAFARARVERSPQLVTLVGEFQDGRVLSGETAIAAAGGRIARVSLLPERPRCLPQTCEAIARADVVVAGPGSLFTSILPPLLVPDVAAAIRRSRATRILVANLMTEPGETDDYSVLEHVLTIERHLGAQLFDYVIYNTAPVPADLAAAYAARGARPIAAGSFELGALEKLGIRPIGVPLVSEQPAGKIRHNPDRLAAAIAALGQGKLTGWRSRAEAGGV